MFSGIITAQGRVTRVNGAEPTPTDNKSYALTISTPYDDLELGESIAVNGVCLTVAAIEAPTFLAHLSPETLKKTALGTLNIGDKVHLERALRLSDRLGGHFVTGHVDTVAQVKSVIPVDDCVRLEIVGISKADGSNLVSKGSIAIDGVSLTLNEVNSEGFSVMLIPHTQQLTHLASLKPDMLVNVEFDLIVKTLSKQLKEITL